MRVKLTDERARKVAAPATGAAFIRDTDLVGFGLRITSAGAKSWIVEGKVRGRTIRRTVARIERLTAAEARGKARKILAGMSEGTDPLLSARSERARSATLAEIRDEYLKTRRHLRPSTQREYAELLERYLKDWLSLPVTRI